MMPDDPPNPVETLPMACKCNEQWVKLCDDFVDLEGECALLYELLISLNQRDLPLDAVSKHGLDRFGSQLKARMATFKQQLYKLRDG
ncbi:hypothetical protein [Cellvibrio mixtus]|uniref:hypothetical protein n=1 Tax=Cellvibrio mixtus TaxID=39650 RepID=UPI0005865F58|nr:hypothetical protein [Cellvibrio mixtus]